MDLDTVMLPINPVFVACALFSSVLQLAVWGVINANSVN